MTTWPRSYCLGRAAPGSEQPPGYPSRPGPDFADWRAPVSRSCLLHRFVKNEWRVLSSQTIGVEFASKIIKVGTGARRKRIKLQVQPRPVSLQAADILADNLAALGHSGNRTIPIRLAIVLSRCGRRHPHLRYYVAFVFPINTAVSQRCAGAGVSQSERHARWQQV